MTEGEFREVLKTMSQPGIKALSIRDFFPNGEVEFKALSSYESILRYCTTKVWASWKACDLVAQEVMRTPFKVMRGTSQTETRVKGLDILLQYPNDRMTWAELLYVTAMHVKLVGNSFWYKSGGQIGTGRKPEGLIPINPSRVQIVTDAATGEIIGYSVSGVTPDGKVLRAPYEPWEIVHYKRPHPHNDYYGLGDVEAGQSLIQDALSAADAQEAQWRNGAVPSGILVKKTEYPSSPAEWAKMKSEWQKQYGGPSNSGKVGWLGGEWTHIRLGLTPAEMNRVEATKASKEDIFALHGVPLSVAGVKDAANYATAQIDDVRFRAYAVAPMVKIIEDTLNTDIITDWGDDLAVRFTVTGLVNIGAVLESVLPAFDRGILSINEVRAMMGLQTDPENPLWSEHYINAGLSPLSLSGLAANDTSGDAAKAIVARFVTDGMKRKEPQ